jgi:hypothetical protein
LRFYDVGMTRRADPERIHLARPAAIRNRLVSSGKDPQVAEQLCNAWEAEAVLRDLKRDGDYWEAGKLWIDAQRGQEAAAIVTDKLPQSEAVDMRRRRLRESLRAQWIAGADEE